MTKFFTLAALSGLLLAAPATAQNFMGSFLSRYQDQSQDFRLAALETTQIAPASLTAMAQEGGVPLMLNDVIRLALENNIDVGVNRFSPLISEYAIAAAYQRFDPTLTLSGNVSRNTSPAISQLDGAALNSRLNGNYSVVFNHLMRFGTAYQVRFSMNRSSTNSEFSTVNPSYNGTLQYSFSQPLLRNFGTLVNTSQITIAQNNLEISEIQFEQQVMDTVLQATNLYWDLVGAREDLRVQEAALGLAQRTLNDNIRQVEIGTLPPIDVIQAEGAVARGRESLVLARYNLTRNEDNIKQLVSRVPDPALVLLSLNPIEDVRNRTDPVLPVGQAIQLALVNRPEMRQFDLEMENNGISLAVAKNQLRPSFDITGSFTQAGIGGDQLIRQDLGLGGTSFTRVPGGVGGAFGDMFAFDFTGYSIGFSLQIPLSNQSAQANHSRAVAQTRLTESRRAATAQQIATEVRDAYNQIEMNRARIDAAEVARQLAERQLDAEQQKFTLGASEIRFVLEEQQNLVAAQTSEINALVAYVKAIAAYDRAIGRTLELNNIQIEQQLRPAIASTSP